MLNCDFYCERESGSVPMKNRNAVKQRGDLSMARRRRQAGRTGAGLPAALLSLIVTAGLLLGPGVAAAQMQVRLQCGKLGLVTLSNQFTLITYGDGTSSKRIDATAVSVARGTVASAASVAFMDGTVLSLRAARGADYLIQKQGGGQIACRRK